jgi:transposase
MRVASSALVTRNVVSRNHSSGAGRKTDIEDSRWLARVCQFGLGQPSFVPDEAFCDLRNLVRHRRTLVGQRSQTRNRVQKVLDRSGIRIGGVLSDVFGLNGRRILDGLVARRPVRRSWTRSAGTFARAWSCLVMPCG